MAHICATGTMGRLKSWHIYVPLAVDGSKGVDAIDKNMYRVFFLKGIAQDSL